MSPSRNEDVANPGSPSPTLRPRKVSPLFQAPIPSPAPPPSSSPSQDSSPPSPPPVDGDAAPSWSTDAPSDPSPSAAESGGTRSTGRELKLSKAGLKAGIGAAYRQACTMVAAVAATDLE